MATTPSAISSPAVTDDADAQEALRFGDDD